MVDVFKERIEQASEAQPAKPAEDVPVGTQMQNIGTVVGLANPAIGAGLSTLGFLSNMSAGSQQLGQPMLSGPSIMHALSQTMAGRVLGLSSPVTNQVMYGGASPSDFSQEQKQTTGYGKGLTPEAIDAIYGGGFSASPYSQGPGMGGGYNSSQFDHAANVEAQIAQSQANKAMKEAAQQAMEASIGRGDGSPSSTSSPASSAPSSDKGTHHFAGGGMINDNTPLKDLFMGIYG
jgi:hypothetical protein